MERDVTIVTEVDDYRNAIQIGLDMHGQPSPVAFAIMAQWCATMRERYVEVGKALAQAAD